MLTPVLLALGSAALFALGSALQHSAAGDAPSSEKRQMVLSLLRRPAWLIGAVLCAGAFGLHATALANGDLALVQPIILTGMVMSIFARAVIARRRPSRRELALAGVTWAGLVLFISALETSQPGTPSQSEAGLVVAGGALLAGGLAAAAHRVERRVPIRGVLLAAGAGVLFGLVAGLVKLTVAEVGAGLVHALTRWSLWAVIVVGAGAILLNQRAYQATRLSVSAPVLNIAQLFVSLIFGLIVFDERLFASGPRIALELLGLVIMVVGVIKLAGLADRTAGSPQRQDAAASPVSH